MWSKKVASNKPFSMLNIRPCKSSFFFQFRYVSATLNVASMRTLWLYFYISYQTLPTRIGATVLESDPNASQSLVGSCNKLANPTCGQYFSTYLNQSKASQTVAPFLVKRGQMFQGLPGFLGGFKVCVRSTPPGWLPPHKKSIIMPMSLFSQLGWTGHRW